MAIDYASLVKDIKPSQNKNKEFDYAKSLGGSKKQDLSTVDGLAAYAQSQGMGDVANRILEKQEPKLSPLGRLSAGLSALNPANAIYSGIEASRTRGTGAGIATGLVRYAKDISTGVIAAITGKDIQPERKFFADVAQQLGAKQGADTFVLGLIGDIFLDPSTYFGGAIVKGVVKAFGGATKVGTNVLSKVAPGVAEGLTLAKEGFKDAFGRALVSGYKTSDGLVDNVMRSSNVMKIKVVEAVKDIYKRFTSNVLSDTQMEEFMYKSLTARGIEQKARTVLGTGELGGEIAGRMGTNALLESVKGIPEQERLAKELLNYSKEMSVLANVTDPYSVYMPVLKQETLANAFKEARSSNLVVGSRGYLKEFKNVLPFEQVEKDVRNVLATRAAQVIKDKETANILRDAVERFGKPLDAFKDSSEALDNGYHLIREKGIFGKEIGYVSKWDAKFLKEQLTPEFATIDYLAKATGFDAVTDLFKRSVTGIFAPFHIRNWMSGILQNFEVFGKDALNPMNSAIGAKIAKIASSGKELPEEMIKINGKMQSLRKLYKPLIDRFSGSEQWIADFQLATRNGTSIGDLEKTFSKYALKETIKTAGLGRDAIPFRVARAVGQFIELQQKATAYTIALKQGKTVSQALRLTERAGFDYRALTQFESKVLRRIIPFYSFTRKNIELQLRTLGENPERINQIIRSIENLSEISGGDTTSEEKASLPQFLKESFGIKIGKDKEGLQQYVSSFGTPVEQFIQLITGNPVLQTISTMNPLLKAPIEIGIGKDSFREKDLKDVYDAREYSAAPKIVKDILDIKEVTKPTYKMGIGGKYVQSGTRKVYVADPVKLLIARSLFTSRGVTYLDQIFDGDLKGFAKYMKLFTGIKPYSVDVEGQKSYQNLKNKQELEAELVRLGKLKQYQTTYKVKNPLK